MPYYRAVAQAPAPTPQRIGVLLINLGTPDSPSYLDVQRYLREFLSDRRVIDTARPVWLPILYGLILPLRPLRSARNYRKIWMPDGSPLAVYSSRLTDRVAERLRESFGDSVRVALGMSYGKPAVAQALKALLEQNVRRLLVLPLYPQYCSSTTGSAFDRTVAALGRWRWLPETRFVNDYHADEGYIGALAARIEEHWRGAGERTHLVLSYHGIPASCARAGDPYEAQARSTTAAVVARLKLDAGSFTHCYQSRFGRVEWIKPCIGDALAQLVQRGVRKLTVASPSFAVDCLETLEEIAIQYRARFRRLGGDELTLVAGLNDDPRHAELLSALIRRHLYGWI